MGSRSALSLRKEKRIDLLRELLPKASTIVFIVNQTSPAAVTESSEVQAATTWSARACSGAAVSVADKLVISVSYDEWRGYVASAPSLWQPVPQSPQFVQLARLPRRHRTDAERKSIKLPRGLPKIAAAHLGEFLIRE
jgi:hypothetical protein